MKTISEFKSGDMVRFADADYEIIKHHISGCTVRPVKTVQHRIGDKVITYRPTSYQVSNATEIEEGNGKEIESCPDPNKITDCHDCAQKGLANC